MIPLVELNSDEIIDMSHLSAIGNKWGDIYEAQLERAMKSRLNKEPKLEFWDSLVKPIMKANAKL
jgi:Acyl-CoA oxidase